ncbi:hypothetical protein [Albidovulum sp.]|uniref:hypothetical protein n=1 Tax=Albidovulum sp. TaxID=1872424 RepID=UPI0039B985B3
MRASFLVAVVLLAPSPVFAGWGHAEWGMSREQITSVRGETPVTQNGEFDSYEGSVGAFAVELSYKFNGSGLIGIEINPKDATECGRFETAIREIYGAPFLKDDGRYVAAEKWHDDGNGNLVSLFSLKADETVSCHVMYEPLHLPNSGGF